MDYTVIINSRSYDLPKKTVSVMNKLDEVLKAVSYTHLTLPTN